MDETAASASASLSTDTATPYHEPAKAIQDPGHPSTTSASAPSTSHGHHNEAQCEVEPVYHTNGPKETAQSPYMVAHVYQLQF
jgi:hypothetical protein